jgi:hypothetical protein
LVHFQMVVCTEMDLSNGKIQKHKQLQKNTSN